MVNKMLLDFVRCGVNLFEVGPCSHNSGVFGSLFVMILSVRIETVKKTKKHLIYDKHL